MKRKSDNNLTYAIGYSVSALAHLICSIIALIVLESNRNSEVPRNQVFSVTIEGGQIIGGITQAPDKQAKKETVLPNEKAATAPEKSETSKKVEQKKIDKPSAIELQEKKKKEEEAKKKLAEDKKKQEAELKKKQDAEKKSKEDAARLKKERDERLQNAINKAVSNYQGESARAGGQGFGAAALGGKGMGGGILESPEFIRYMGQLTDHIKRGWHWLPGSERLVAVVVVNIQPTGVVQSANISTSSGNSRFDDSALRAVYKASPVPPAPTSIYEKFRNVSITFDSHDR